jgi:hypothetical protein
MSSYDDLVKAKKAIEKALKATIEEEYIVSLREAKNCILNVLDDFGEKQPRSEVVVAVSNNEFRMVCFNYEFGIYQSFFGPDKTIEGACANLEEFPVIPECKCFPDIEGFKQYMQEYYGKDEVPANRRLNLFLTEYELVCERNRFILVKAGNGVSASELTVEQVERGDAKRHVDEIRARLVLFAGKDNS